LVGQLANRHLLHLPSVPDVVQLGRALLHLLRELDVSVPALLDPRGFDALFDDSWRHFCEYEGVVDGEAQGGRFEGGEGDEDADVDLGGLAGGGGQRHWAVGQVVGEQLVAADADLLPQLLQALVRVELRLQYLGEVLLDVELLLVLQQSAEDVESLGVVAHEVVDDGHVVAEEELGEVVLAAEYLLLQVLDEERVLFADVEVQDGQPLLVLAGQIAVLGAVVVLHHLLAQQGCLLSLAEEDAVEGPLDDCACRSATVEFALVDLNALDHRQYFVSLVSDFGERADGLVVGPVGEEDLGDPEGDFLLVVLQLDVLLQVLKAVFN
jgi:hypothetical protein